MTYMKAIPSHLYLLLITYSSSQVRLWQYCIEAQRLWPALGKNPSHPQLSIASRLGPHIDARVQGQMFLGFPRAKRGDA